MPTPATLLLLLAIALTPSWFFLLDAYNHCKKNQVPAGPWLTKVALWPGWGLGALYSTVPSKPAEDAARIYKRFFWLGTGLSLAFWACGLALLVL